LKEQLLYPAITDILKQVWEASSSSLHQHFLAEPWSTRCKPSSGLKAKWGFVVEVAEAAESISESQQGENFNSLKF